jgi:hypothetical protein
MKHAHPHGAQALNMQSQRREGYLEDASEDVNIGHHDKNMLRDERPQRLEVVALFHTDVLY